MEKKSDYQISTSMNDGILEIIQKGEVKEIAVINLATEVINIIKANGVKNVLIDVRAIKGRFSNSEIYYRARSCSSDIPKVNTAIVDLPENADYQSFHETAARNAGLSLMWFINMDTARTWLKSK